MHLLHYSRAMFVIGMRLKNELKKLVFPIVLKELWFFPAWIPCFFLHKILIFKKIQWELWYFELVIYEFRLYCRISWEKIYFLFLRKLIFQHLKSIDKVYFCTLYMIKSQLCTAFVYCRVFATPLYLLQHNHTHSGTFQTKFCFTKYLDFFVFF